MNTETTKNIKLRLLQFAIDVFIGTLKIFPRKQRQTLLTGISRLIFRFAKRTRSRCLENITRAHPEMTETQVLALAKKSYANVVLGVTETFWLEDIDLHVHYGDGVEALLRSGKPVVVAAMHMGCCEAVPLAVEQVTSRSTTLSNIPKNMPFAFELYQNVGINVIDRNKKNAFFDVLKAARTGEVVSLHSDFHGEELDVDFFGCKTGAPAGIATLSALARASVLIAYSYYEDDATCHVNFELFSEEPAPKAKEGMHDMVRQMYTRYEALIRQHSDNWYWSYHRFR